MADQLSLKQVQSHNLAEFSPRPVLAFPLTQAHRRVCAKTHLPSTLRARRLPPVQTDHPETYLRANISINDGKISATLCGRQGSGNLLGLMLANALRFIPSGVKSLPDGAEVKALLIGQEGP